MIIFYFKNIRNIWEYLSDIKYKKPFVLINSFVEMLWKQEVFREKVVSFYLKHSDKPLVFTVKHFQSEGCHRMKIYRIIKTYKERQTTERKKNLYDYRRVMTKEKVKKLYRMPNHSDKFNYSSAGRKFITHRKNIRYWLKKKNIKQYKKKKCPKYKSEDQKEVVRLQCQWLYRNCRQYDFVINDEKYFTLSHTYFSSPTKSWTPESVSHKPTAKFEPKVLWIVISKNGLSQPLLRVQKKGFAINRKIYLKECIKKRFIPFLNTNHSDGNFLFWPDKASSHYAGEVVQYLRDQNLRFVEWERNSTNVPQCRPIEDFFGYLVQLVYEKGWKANNPQHLVRRIKDCFKKVDHNVVKSTVESVRKRLYKAGRYRLVVH